MNSNLIIFNNLIVLFSLPRMRAMMVELYRTILNIAPYAFAVGNKCFLMVVVVKMMMIMVIEKTPFR